MSKRNEEHADMSSSDVDRRHFLKTAAAGSIGLATLAGCDEDTREAFFQHHFKELSQEEVQAVIARHQRLYEERFGKKVDIKATGASEGVELAYALDLARCVGCRRCVVACQRENNCSRDPQIQWIRVLQMEKEVGVDVFHADHFYAPDTVPERAYFYMPVACNQCRNPPCTKVCPVNATWQEPDGITVIDYDWCIGCRYCMAACPYSARHFNWEPPTLPVEEQEPRVFGRNSIMPPDALNTNTHLLGNRPRPAGVVEKCTFCIHRTREGRYPACVEACPVGARKFGNLADPESEVRYILENKRVFILKEELNTQPRFYYFYG